MPSRTDLDSVKALMVEAVGRLTALKPKKGIDSGVSKMNSPLSLSLELLMTDERTTALK